MHRWSIKLAGLALAVTGWAVSNASARGPVTFRSVQGTGVLIYLQPSGTFTSDPATPTADPQTQYILFLIKIARVLEASPDTTGLQSITWRLEVQDPQALDNWVPLAEDSLALDVSFGDVSQRWIRVSATPTVQVPVDSTVRLLAMVTYQTSSDPTTVPLAVYLTTNQRLGWLRRLLGHIASGWNRATDGSFCGTSSSSSSSSNNSSGTSTSSSSTNSSANSVLSVPSTSRKRLPRSFRAGP